MHPTTTRNEFLRLRIQGLSFAKIGRRLGVSKPTLIAWSRKAKPDLAARIEADQQRFLKSLDDTVDQQLANLTRRHNFLRQEICSRALRDVSTPDLETLAGELNQQIQHLKQNSTSAATPGIPESSSPSTQPVSQVPESSQL